MRSILVSVVTVVLSLTAQAAETLPHVELTTSDGPVSGKPIITTRDETVLTGPDGRLHIVENRLVTRKRTVSPQFRPWSHTLIRTAVLKELGSGFASAQTRRYVVFAKDSQTAGKYATLFDDTYNTVYRYFSVRGVSLSEPEFPMVAIVFSTHADFAKYAAKDKVRASRTLMGYYHALTNRVALFEGMPGDGNVASVEADGFSWNSMQGQLKDTIVHEATHQVAFNTGLHGRLSANPKWAVEGLATVFETAAARNTSSDVAKRINVERYVWFGNYSKERRQPKSLATFLASDRPFETSALDAYSEAWAFSFFLIETRPRQYVQYLKKVAQRDAFHRSTPESRLADFQSVFGKETALLEAQFLRYVGGLKK